jgi:predicted DNA-binding protein with PD1-like motif
MQSKLIDDRAESTFAVAFEAGEEVMSGLLQFATEHNLAGAHFTAIGAFERVTLGFFEMQKKDYKRIPINEQVELMSLVGNIARDSKGEPKVHAHVSSAKRMERHTAGICWTRTSARRWRSSSWNSARHLCRTTRPDLGLALLELTR